jgi:hypothetical protein
MRAALLSIVALVGCGTETGNGLVTIKAALTSSDPQTGTAIIGKDAQQTVVTVDSARASLRHIEFQRPGGKQTCDDFKSSNTERVKCDGGKIRVNGPIAIDLLTRNATPSLADLEIPADTYMRVDVRFDEARPAEGVVMPSDPLAGSAIIASGELSYPMGATTRFDFALTFTEDARFENSAGIRIEESGVNQVLLSLDVARWFSAIPITQCIQNGDLTIDNGHVTIEDKGAGNCASIEGAMKEAIKSSGRLDEE